MKKASSSPVARFIRDVRAYLKTASGFVWVVIAAVFGGLDQIMEFFPKEWSDKVPSWLPLTVAILALLVGPFLAFQRISHKLEEIDEERKRWRSDFLRAFTEFKIDTFFGENSRTTRQNKADGLRDLYEQRKKEIEQGDFSRAAEIIPIARLYLPVLNHTIPSDNPRAFQRAKDEISLICDKVEQYMEEKHKAITHLQLPPSQDHPSSPKAS